MSSIPTSKTNVAILVLLSIWLIIYFVSTLPEGNQWVDHTTKMPDLSYPLVDYKPLRLEYGPAAPYQAMNLTRIKTELIDKDRLKKPQDQHALHYEKAVVCRCSKCGGTSFFAFLFEQIFDAHHHSSGLLHRTGKYEDWQGAFEENPIPVK